MGQAGCANGRIVTATPERLTEGGEVWAGPGHGHAARNFDWQNRELSVGKGPDALGGAAWRRTASTRQTAWGVSQAECQGQDRPGGCQDMGLSEWDTQSQFSKVLRNARGLKQPEM